MMCKQKILPDINLYKTLYELLFPEQVSTSMSDGERRFGVVKLGQTRVVRECHVKLDCYRLHCKDSIQWTLRF